MRLVWFGLCVLTALGCGAGTSATGEKQAGDKKATEKAPAAEVTVNVLSLDDFHALVASHKGKVVVVDCWSTT
jgi:hypothetical protein